MMVNSSTNMNEKKRTITSQLNSPDMNKKTTYDIDNPGPLSFCSWMNIVHLFRVNTSSYLPYYAREIWRCVHPRKVIFPEGNTRGKYNYFEGEQIFISPLCKGNKCFIPPGHVLVNSAKWNLLAIFDYKIIISEHLWS
jgi:hypothetical protein